MRSTQASAASTAARCAGLAAGDGGPLATSPGADAASLNGGAAFDRNVLLQAKVVTYLKGSLDASTAYLSKFTRAVSSLPDFASGRPVIVRLKAKFYPDEPPVLIMIPLGALAADLDRRLPLAEIARDLPRGRNRAGWKREFLKTLQNASADLEGVSEKQILDAVRKIRAQRRKPELTVVAEAAETATA